MGEQAGRLPRDLRSQFIDLVTTGSRVSRESLIPGIACADGTKLPVEIGRAKRIDPAADGISPRNHRLTVDVWADLPLYLKKPIDSIHQSASFILLEPRRRNDLGDLFKEAPPEESIQMFHEYVERQSAAIDLTTGQVIPTEPQAAEVAPSLLLGGSWLPIMRPAAPRDLGRPVDMPEREPKHAIQPAECQPCLI